MSQFKTKDFIALKNKWYKKLKKEGFEDIEPHENSLKEWTSSNIRKYDELSSEATQEYHRLASQFLFEHEFEDKREQTIWYLHAEGFSTTEISNEMRKRNFRIRSRSTVHLVIKNLVKIMMVKYGVNTGKKRPDSN